jgi:hypothetical protein
VNGQTAWDQGFVAAAPTRVYEALADPRSYPSWWPGARLEDRGPPADHASVLRLPGIPPLEVRAESARQGVGLVLRVGGRYRGTLEWYLDPFEEGTIVNCLLAVDLRGSGALARRRLHRIRVAVHRGMVWLKRTLE